MHPLPSRLLIVTDRNLARGPLDDLIAEALAGGARWIWFRDRDLARAERRALGVRLQQACARAGALLTVGGDVDDALAIGASAVHLPSGGDVAAARARLGAAALIGASAHTIGEAGQARRAGADYVTLSPIFDSASKPGYGPALGVAALAAAKSRRVPVVALGGIDAANASACLAAGADAIAVMGAVMRADSPRDSVIGLLSAVRRSESAA